jgi:glutathione S-transferase
MAIEFYLFPPSPRAFKVLTVANHTGADYVIRPLDLLKGAHREPAYVAMNPNMKMPTMKHGDFVLWESNAIATYLADIAPERGLMPADAQGRASVLRWLFWESAHWDSTCAVYVFENVVKPKIRGLNPDVEALKRAEEPFHRFASVLDGTLRGKRYIMGDALTLADLALGAVLFVADAAQYPIAAYAEVLRWRKELASLPAWQKAVQQATAPANAA